MDRGTQEGNAPNVNNDVFNWCNYGFCFVFHIILNFQIFTIELLLKEKKILKANKTKQNYLLLRRLIFNVAGQLF